MPDWVPQGGDSEFIKRVLMIDRGTMQKIFIGDVQGCADELEILLRRAEETFGTDHEVWIAGDLVNRGPWSLRALQRIRPLVDAGRAHYVLGNHELKLIETGLGLRPTHKSDTFGDILSAPDAAEWIEWLRHRPIVETSKIGSRKFAMVHASVHPSWNFETLQDKARAVQARLGSADIEEARRFLRASPAKDAERENLARITSARSATEKGEWSKKEPSAPEQAWHFAWRAADHDYGVVYGHWARQGLHLAPGLRGLDTGCVHHGRGREGRLTAWVPDASVTDCFALPDTHFWQINALQCYRRDEE